MFVAPCLQVAEAKEEEDTRRFAMSIADEVPRVSKLLGGIREQLDSQVAYYEATNARLGTLIRCSSW
jgi:hypothetical protein